MPRNCVVGGCTRTSTKNTEISFFRFPKSERVRRQWVRFVGTTRSDFKVSNWSHVCSAHFTDDCQDQTSFLKQQLGIKALFKLKKGAVPTRKAPNSSGDLASSSQPIASSSSPTATSHGRPQGLARTAFQKRERQRVLEEAFSEYASSTTHEEDNSDTSASSADESASSADESASSAEESASSDPTSSEEECVQDTSDTPSDEDFPSEHALKSASCQTDDRLHAVKDQGTQTTPRWRCSIRRNVVKANIFPGDPSNRPKYSRRSKKTQTQRKMFHPVNKGVQFDQPLKSTSTECELVEGSPLRLLKPSPMPADVDLHKPPSSPTMESASEPQPWESPLDSVGEDLGSEYIPSGVESSDSYHSSSDQETTTKKDLVQQPKYIIFHDNLLELFTVCIKCLSPTKGRLWRPNGGTMVEVEQICRKRGCGFIRKWRTQPMVGNISAGNLMLSAAILTSGSSPKKFIGALTSMNVAAYSLTSFFNHQKWYLQPAICHIWTQNQEEVVSKVMDKGKASLGCDMRADSMGHSAKFGCYSTVEMNQNKVLHLELVQKNECENKSNRMEKEGLLRTLAWMEKMEVDVETIVTDRHRQIAKYIRENLAPLGVKHYFDVWHIAKGVKMKLLKVAKLSGCADVGSWVHVITNNLYWVAASTPDGDGELMLAKFESILDHVMNIHDHDNPLFPKCAHGPLEGRKWLKAGTKPAEELEKILSGVWLQKDIQMMSPSMQTSSVESFHSVINHFAPKMLVYSYEGMLCRLYLAALHYNENAGRKQKKNTKGEPVYTITFPRSKQDSGGYTVKKVLVNCTYEYAKQIMQRAIFLCCKGDKHTRDDFPQLVRKPGRLTDTVTRPDKNEAVRKFISRFGKSTPAVGRPPGLERHTEDGGDGGGNAGQKGKGKGKEKLKGGKDKAKSKKTKSHGGESSTGSTTKDQGPSTGTAEKGKKTKRKRDSETNVGGGKAKTKKKKDKGTEKDKEEHHKSQGEGSSTGEGTGTGSTAEKGKQTRRKRASETNVGGGKAKTKKKKDKGTEKDKEEHHKSQGEGSSTGEGTGTGSTAEKGKQTKRKRASETNVGGGKAKTKKKKDKGK